jgi:hypothetical protein
MECQRIESKLQKRVGHSFFIANPESYTGVSRADEFLTRLSSHYAGTIKIYAGTKKNSI